MRPSWFAVALTAALLLGILVPPDVARATPVGPRLSVGVLAIEQSPSRLTEQDALTVAMQLSSGANVKQVYFTFCQMTYPQCYLPTTMNPGAGGWYSGTTYPMSSYHQMSVGVRAGYNITIVFNDNSTQSEPALPNTFSNLTLGEIQIPGSSSEYVFALQVVDQVYGLSGDVVDRATGTPVAGATVSLTPGNETPVTTGASGAYNFSGVPNGTYTLSVVKTGYSTSTATVTVSGKNAVENVALLNASLNPGGGPKPVAQAPNFFLTPMGAGVLAAVAVVVAAGVGLLLRSRRSPGSPTSRGPSGSAEDEPKSGSG